MKCISVLEQASKEAIQYFAQKRNLTEYLPESYQHPQEDYLLAEENPPIFVVADGVTLDFLKLVESKTKYPNPSPAGDISRIFCKAVIENAKERYPRFDEAEIREVFKKANAEVAEHNKKVGKSDISGNKTGFFSATGAFVVVRENRAYWASICDSFVAHFDKDMNMKFMSSGVCSPYAVINGEERMVDHLESGSFGLAEGDRVFVFTDGFEEHVRNVDFQQLFLDWDDNLKQRIADFSAKMIPQDPEKYGHERSLIVVSI